MFPALAVTTPPASCSRDAARIAFVAPRILNEATGWRFSSFSQMSVSGDADERRAHGGAGDPVASGLDLRERDQNSSVVPLPVSPARRIRYSAEARSSIARPSDSNTVTSSGDVRPGAMPASTSPSSALM